MAKSGVILSAPAVLSREDFYPRGIPALMQGRVKERATRHAQSSLRLPTRSPKFNKSSESFGQRKAAASAAFGY